MEPTQTTPSDSRPSMGENIWGPKFPIYGLIVILIFLALLIGRAWYLGVPIKEVFRNTDPKPAAVDSIPERQ